MAFMESFLGGLGQKAGETAQTMLQTHLQQLRSLSDIYKSASVNPAFSAEVRKSALGRAAQLDSAHNALGMPDMQTVNQLSDTNGMFPTGETADTTAPSMNTKPGQLPYNVRSPYVNGLLSSPIQAQNEAAVAGNKANTERGGQFKAMTDSGFGSMTGLGDNTDMGKLLGSYQQQKMLNPRAYVPPFRVVNGSWIDSKGQTHLGEQYYDIGGHKFGTDRMLLDFDPSKPFHVGDVKEMTGEQGLQYFVAPNFAPQSTGLQKTPAPMQTTEVSAENPSTLTKTQTTVRQAVQPGAAPPTQQLNIGGQPPTAIPGVQNPPGANVPPPAQATPPVQAPQQGAPPPAQVKQTYIHDTAKLVAAQTGVTQLTRIDDILNDPQHRALVGAALGRAGQVANSIGSAGAMNWLHAAFATEDEAKKAYVDKASEALLSVSTDPSTPRDVASVSAELYTLMRAVNGLELAAMSSGQGISRLYIMMHKAMLNPTQAADIIKGHIAGLADVFAGVHGGIMKSEGRGWNDLAPEDQAAYERFLGSNTKSYFPGYTPTNGASVGPPKANTSAQPPTVVFKIGKHKGETGYLAPDGNGYTLTPPPTEPPSSPKQ